MDYRIYSKNHGYYVNSQFWRENTSDPNERFALTQDGRIVSFSTKGDGLYSVDYFNNKEFIVEPWTGYFDKDGKKIYCGDILEQYSMFDFKSKVVWKHGSFVMVPIDPEGVENTMGYSGILTGWIITGNIHEVEYSEGK